MNLLIDSWMPVRKRDGSREWVSPTRLSDPDIIAFDADRADFNGALAQFAIGLLQTTAPIESPIEWRKLLKDPPDATILRDWFVPFITAFNFDDDGARFMQDFSLNGAEGSVCSVAALFIESPGENTLKNNTDHFIKRDGVSTLCFCCAATALYTLQINAPSGGAGHRTGLRGGGPLTTLLLHPVGVSLWQDMWLNVQERQAFLDWAGDPEKRALHYSFPWLADISKIQADGGETAPAQVHSSHIFWAMPRRIRFNFERALRGVCAICERESQQLVSEYVTCNYGLNYKGAWDHPLSPYYETKEGWLPIHPQPGGFGYRHWLSWVLGNNTTKNNSRRARVVEYFLQSRMRTVSGALRLWAFGYDMDNMKARCWYESTLPLYGLGDCELEKQQSIEAEVGNWLAAAELASSCLRRAVKDAWFSRDARGDFSAVDVAFWSRTEQRFYFQLSNLTETIRLEVEFDTAAVREEWLKHISGTAIALFDEDFVGSGQIESQNPKRASVAFQELKRSLFGPKMRQALGLRADAKTNGKRRARDKCAVA